MPNLSLADHLRPHLSHLIHVRARAKSGIKRGNANNSRDVRRRDTHKCFINTEVLVHGTHCIVLCPTKTPEADCLLLSFMHNGRTSFLVLLPYAHTRTQETMLYPSFRKNRHCISVFSSPLHSRSRNASYPYEVGFGFIFLLPPVMVTFTKRRV